jgi:hypothetical protein
MAPREKIYSKAELRDIMRETARETARETVRETLQGLGVDMSQPLEVQHDFAFVREFRTTWASVRRRVILVAVGVLASGGAGALMIGLKSYFSN